MTSLAITKTINEFKQEASHKLLVSLPLLIFSLNRPDILIRQDNAKGEGMIIQCIKQYNRKKRIRLRTRSSSFQQATANSKEIKSEVLKQPIEIRK